MYSIEYSKILCLVGLVSWNGKKYNVSYANLLDKYVFFKVLYNSLYEILKKWKLTECDNLPHEDAEAPDVGLRGEHWEVEGLRGHPPVK